MPWFFYFFLDDYWSDTPYLQHSPHRKCISVKFIYFNILQCSPYQSLWAPLMGSWCFCSWLPSKAESLKKDTWSALWWRFEDPDQWATWISWGEWSLGSWYWLLHRQALWSSGRTPQNKETIVYCKHNTRNVGVVLLTQCPEQFAGKGDECTKKYWMAEVI